MAAVPFMAGAWIRGGIMNKLFLLAVLVPLLLAMPLAFAAASESIAASGSVGASSGAAASESAVSSPGAAMSASPESKGSPGAVAATGAATVSSSSETNSGAASSTGAGASEVKGDVAPSPAVKPAPTSLPPIKDTSPKPLPAVKPKPIDNTNPPINSTTAYSVIVVPSSATLAVGQVQQFEAYLVVNGAIPADVPFTWSTAGGIGTVTQNGLFTAAAIGNGAVTAAFLTPNGTVSGSAHVTVTGSPPPGNNSSYSLFIVPPNATLNIGDAQQFTVYMSSPNGSLVQISNSVLSWAAAGGIGNVGATGQFTATSAGTGTVSATYTGPTPVGFSNAVVTAQVTVNSSPPPPPGNQTYSLWISPSSASLMVGATQHFIAQLYDANGTYVMDVPDSDLAWLSSNTAVGTIDSFGVFSALSNGTALVKVTYIGIGIANVSTQNMATVIVGNAPPPANVSSILVAPDPAALFVGQSQQFIATAYDASGTSLGVLPNAFLNWSVTSGIGAIGADGIFNASTVGSGIVTAVYTGASPLAQISDNASVTVSQFVPGPIGGGGSGGSGGNGGASFKTSTTVSFSCMGKPGTVKITVYDSAVKNATVEIIYMGGSKSEKVLVKEITGTTSLDFTPSQAGDYVLRVSVGTDQTNANFFVPYCGPQTTNVTQNITVRLEPSRELVFSKLVNYPGGFSKRFSVYKITDGQTETFESDIVLYLNYTGNSTRYDFDILDSVPSSVLTRSGQITFADRPSVLFSEPRFEWHAKSVSKGGRLSYAYSFSRPLTEQMIALFDAPTIREAATGPQAKPAQDGGLLAASIGPIFGITVPLLGVLFAFLVLLVFLYFFLFGRKKEDE